MTEAARGAAADLEDAAKRGELSRSADGVPRGQAILDGLVRLLDLEQIEDNIFRGVSPPTSPTRVFGGQVAAQALVAAGRSVADTRAVHSLHAYFIRGGDPSVPIIYQVERTRDGRSFTTRRVSAIQHGKTIFTLSASFQQREEGIEHQDQMPDVPGPEHLPSLGERVAEFGEQLVGVAAMPRPIDIRHVTEPAWASREKGPREARSQVWMRADGALGDDPLLHVCVMAFASDMTLLDAALMRHGVYWGLDKVLGASLDHAMWFHRDFRADDWILYDCDSPSASGGRGLATGRFFSSDGALLATVVQEGLLRVVR